MKNNIIDLFDKLLDGLRFGWGNALEVGCNRGHNLVAIRKAGGLFLVVATSLVVGFWLSKSYNPSISNETIIAKADAIPTSSREINSRFKTDEIVKAELVDLDGDGTNELIGVTKYNDGRNTVFYYYGFFRFNQESQVWDEYFSEQLNILNLGLLDEKDIENKDKTKKLAIEVWSKELTKIEVLGDLTGDDCPEILFSSMIQGKPLRNNIIVAQGGKSHYKYIVYKDELANGKAFVFDGLLIGEYVEFENNDYDKPLRTVRDVLEWNDELLYFETIDTLELPFSQEGVEIPLETSQTTG